MANEKRLIDANALLKELDKFINPMPDANGLHFISGLSTAITEIENAPTVDAVEVVHGRWEKHMENMEDGFGREELVQTGLMCSVCGNYSCCCGNFCKNCGAKMDGDGNG